MSCMVVPVRPDATREAIARRLHQALDELRIPKRGRPAWLSRRLRPRVRVTHQAARKWLEGESAPGLLQFIAIAISIGINLDWLILGRGAIFATQPAPPSVPPHGEPLLALSDAHAHAPRQTRGRHR